MVETMFLLPRNQAYLSLDQLTFLELDCDPHAACCRTLSTPLRRVSTRNTRNDPGKRLSRVAI